MLYKLKSLEQSVKEHTKRKWMLWRYTYFEERKIGRKKTHQTKTLK